MTAYVSKWINSISVFVFASADILNVPHVYEHEYIYTTVLPAPTRISDKIKAVTALLIFTVRYLFKITFGKQCYFRLLTSCISSV